ncbi:MAG: T9SS type A sorting domain-containing protein, partial [Cytophagaceae bacterium]|nr:T9SS type A sorting domain-containing protein [Cytophagaceae bacterium]
SPVGGYTNVAELEFYNGTTKLQGTAFGDPGGPWNGLPERAFDKVFDGNTATFYDGNNSQDGYVGLTLTNCGGATNRLAAEVNLTAEEMAFTVTVNPNPSTGRANVRVNLPEAGLVSLSVLSPAGQVLVNQERNGVVGENPFEVDYGHFPNGLYLLRVQSQGRKAVLKLVKLQE